MLVLVILPDVPDQPYSLFATPKISEHHRRTGSHRLWSFPNFTFAIRLIYVIMSAAEQNVALIASPNIEVEFCPETSVPLHQLCNHCSAFLENWEVLDWFVEFWAHEPLPTSFNKEYPFATVAYIRSQHICHFCQIISRVSTDESNVRGVSGHEITITLRPLRKRGLRNDKRRLEVAVLVGDDIARHRIMLETSGLGCPQILINSYQSKVSPYTTSSIN